MPGRIGRRCALVQRRQAPATPAAQTGISDDTIGTAGFVRPGLTLAAPGGEGICTWPLPGAVPQLPPAPAVPCEEAGLRQTVRLLALTIALISGALLARSWFGALLGLPALAPGAHSMAPASALCVLVLSLAMLCVHAPRLQWLGSICCLLVAVLSFGNMVALFLGWLEIEQFVPRLMSPEEQDRMAPGSAAGLLLLTYCLDIRLRACHSRFPLVRNLAALGVSLSLLLLVTHVIDLRMPSATERFCAASPQTAALLTLGFVALVLLLGETTAPRPAAADTEETPSEEALAAATPRAAIRPRQDAPGQARSTSRSDRTI